MPKPKIISGADVFIVSYFMSKSFVTSGNRKITRNPLAASWCSST
jgi:hypothetical protein